jgi:hypothetical protein
VKDAAAERVKLSQNFHIWNISEAKLDNIFATQRPVSLCDAFASGRALLYAWETIAAYHWRVSICYRSAYDLVFESYYKGFYSFDSDFHSKESACASAIHDRHGITWFVSPNFATRSFIHLPSHLATSQTPSRMQYTYHGARSYTLARPKVERFQDVTRWTPTSFIRRN